MYDDETDVPAEDTPESAEVDNGLGMVEPRAFGLGLVVGVIVGASAAILLAPDSGTRTRRKIRRGARRLYSRGGSMLEELADRAERKAIRLRKQARQSMKQGVKRGREYANDYADDARSYVKRRRRNFGLG